MIGTEERARSRRHTSRPSILGSITSSTTRSNGLLGEARERLPAVRRLDHLVAVALQRERQQRLDRLLVVDQEDAGGRSGTPQSVDTVPNVLDVRVYRAAFLPALIALFVVAFSLEGRPSAVRTRAVADAFDPARAYGGAGRARLAAAARQGVPAARARGAGRRRPGRPRRRRASRRGLRGRRARPDPAGPSTARRRVETVVGVRPGLSSRRIVVLAHRDSLEAPGLADLSGTAALLELARIFRTRDPSGEPPPDGRPQLVGRDLRKTLVLVSTSGGSGGGAGRAGLGEGAGRREHRRGARAGRPRVGRLAPAVGRAVVERHRPAADRLAAHGGGRGTPGGRSRPGRRARAGQLARRAVPFSVGEQGEIDRVGLPGVLLQASGERGPARGARISRDRFTALGRTSLRALTALDEAGRRGSGGETLPPFAGEPEGVVTMRNVLPDWSVRLIVLCLLLPALLAALDAFFRVRRRRIPTGAWVAWALAAGRDGAAGVGVAAHPRDRGRVPGAARPGAARGPGGDLGAGARRSRRRRSPSQEARWRPG